MRRLFLFAALILAASGLPLVAQQTVLTVTGDGAKPASYSLEQLKKLPVTSVTARDHSGTEAKFTGVAVEELLRLADAPLGNNLRGKALSKAVLVHAADKYQAVFSLAELDSAMTDRVTLLAWSRNDQPLSASEGPLRLIVSGEKRQARWVRQVIAIEVVSIDRPAPAPPAQP